VERVDSPEYVAPLTPTEDSPAEPDGPLTAEDDGAEPPAGPEVAALTVVNIEPDGPVSVYVVKPGAVGAPDDACPAEGEALPVIAPAEEPIELEADGPFAAGTAEPV
jgi:hypothetical protein